MSNAAKRVAAAFPAGAIAGALGGMAGVGGGIIMVPLLRYGCGVSHKAAVATSLAAVFGTSVVATHRYREGNLVDYEAGALIALSGALLAPVGVRIAASLTGTAHSRACGAFMIAASPLIPLRNHVLPPVDPGVTEAVSDPRPTAVTSKVSPPSSAEGSTPVPIEVKMSMERGLAYAGIGAVAGVSSGLFGIGGGLVVVPMMAFVDSTMSHKAIIATSLFAMIPTSFVGSMKQYRMGLIDKRLGAMLTAGAAVGSALGAEYGKVADEDVMKWVFTSIMFLTGLKFLKG